MSDIKSSPKPRKQLTGITVAIKHEHRSGHIVVANNLISEVMEAVIMTPDKGARATSARDEIKGRLSLSGWPNEVKVAANSDIKVTSIKSKTALCLQTGNTSRMYADMLKLQKLFLKGTINGAIMVVPTKPLARVWGRSDSNLVNSTRLLNELKTFSDIITVPLAIIAIGIPGEAKE